MRSTTIFIGTAASLMAAGCAPADAGSDKAVAKADAPVAQKVAEQRPLKRKPGQLETERAEVDQAIDAIYRPYLQPDQESVKADWNMPVWSTAMTKRIARWQKAIGDELTGMNDAGWFCSCQDWDPKTAKILKRDIAPQADGSYEVAVTFTPMTSSPAHTDRLTLVREGSRWLIDDIYFGDSESRLSMQLDAEIAAGGAAP